MVKKTDKIIVGISVGDINGIGLEVVLKTFEDSRMFDFCTPVLFCQSKIASTYKKILGKENLKLNVINDMSKIAHGKLNVLSTSNENVNVEIGKETKEGGKYAYISLQEATKALNEKHIDVLITAPINKNTIQSEIFKFKGHTEYLEEMFEGTSLMILMTDDLKIGLITGHIPISKVAETITPELIIAKTEVLYHSLQQDFGILKPKIAVLGLNPHCGDNGVIGDEDSKIIRPTLEKIQEQGKLVYGPYSADSFFGSESYKNFDGVLAMYHDQGLAPFKTLSFGNGVNFTAGLNIIRTSPDHGTAYEIAGKNEANHHSFREAVFMAIKIHKTRNESLELDKNKLQTTVEAKN
ncbi:MAG: 4-hydroxythreonine-4-phosphate dehydrogenase PdxA [Flavobacteriaceae bacterium]|nr:4-hydroxythreonine-4-phosphate dehydrogenase PdxA [Flavobacteriaceae bacterium]